MKNRKGVGELRSAVAPFPSRDETTKRSQVRCPLIREFSNLPKIDSGRQGPAARDYVCLAFGGKLSEVLPRFL